jgi:hypothetical protein
MIIKFHIPILHVLLFFSFVSCGEAQSNISNITNEGKVKLHFIRYDIPEPSNTDDVRDYNYQLWYLDSAVILEFVAVDYDFLITDAKRPPATLKTKKFVYIDLKTLLCQDYKEFDTIAQPKSNYKLKPGEAILWRFHVLDTPSYSYFSNKFSQLSDTIMNQKKYKRIFFEKIGALDNMTRIIYLTDQYFENLFHISAIKDKQYFPLKLVRIDDYIDGKPFSSVYYEQKNTTLSDFERAVFKSWEYNARTTKLPVITLKEALPKNW